jgi:hypothetical protein
LLVPVIIGITGCKKYPDDPKRYLFKSPMKRIDKGLWQVTQLTIDGEDSTDRVYTGYYTTAINYTFNEVKIRFKKVDHGTISGYRGAYVLPVGLTASQSSAWRFENDKGRIAFFFDSGPNYTNSFQLNTKVQLWDILTLTADKFEIVTTEGKRKIKLTMKPA